MFKKIMLLSVLGLFAMQNASALTQAEETEGKKFDRGSDYGECLDNCRDYHHNVLNWSRGKGKGMCWSECKKAHPKKSKTVTVKETSESY
ncbi:MAG: hypothetical protein NTX86_03795 [Candidatus Dependentiae bacterium]|nr:hypothetical protein [Candidatus Dependentiae bacterium]